jgi:hypothetical protein
MMLLVHCDQCSSFLRYVHEFFELLFKCRGCAPIHAGALLRGPGVLHQKNQHRFPAMPCIIEWVFYCVRARVPRNV